MMRTVMVPSAFSTSDSLAVADDGLALFGSDVFLGSSLITWKIERGKPVPRLFGFALGPYLRDATFFRRIFVSSTK